MTANPIDQDTFDNLVEMTGGELAFIDELVDTYLEDGRGQVAAMRRAAGSGDAETLMRAAHSLKSSSINVGALALANHCRALEEEARDGPVVDARGQVAAIAADFAAAVDALSAARAARSA